MAGVEPATNRLQGGCSTTLSYTGNTLQRRAAFTAALAAFAALAASRCALRC